MSVSLGFKCTCAEIQDRNQSIKHEQAIQYSKANLILNIIPNLKNHRMEKNG